jgi:hypothetical protein
VRQSLAAALLQAGVANTWIGDKTLLDISRL